MYLYAPAVQLHHPFAQAQANPRVGEHTQIREPQVHIEKVLELTAQLIPFEEAGFLDQMRELISTLEKED